MKKITKTQGIALTSEKKEVQSWGKSSWIDHLLRVVAIITGKWDPTWDVEYVYVH